MMTPNTQRFTAMGTEIEGVLCAEPEQAAKVWSAIRETIEHFADRFTRFSPASELSQLNAQAGVAVKVSEDMMAILGAAESMWHATHHLVDPSIGYAVISAGYDKSFELLAPVEHRPLPKMKMIRANMSLVEIRNATNQVKMPIGVNLDFGGLGKGYLLDHLAQIIEQVTVKYWISLGGDMIVSGTDLEDRAWPVGVQDPHQPDKNLGTLQLSPSRWCVATSSTLKRRGVRNGQTWHHIIDPRTGRPSTSDVVSATVVTLSGLEGDAFAKTVLLQGSDEGIRWAEQQPSVEALVVTASGQKKMTTGMQRLFITQ